MEHQLCRGFPSAASRSVLLLHALLGRSSSSNSLPFVIVPVAQTHPLSWTSRGSPDRLRPCVYLPIACLGSL